MSRIFFSAGEASGDAYAARLAYGLQGRGRIEVQGVGGRRLAQLARMVADSSGWGAVSVVESLKVVPKVWNGFWSAREALAHGEPGVFVPIDFGFVNIRLARYAKAIGWRVVYFIPPGSWRRDRQGKDIPEVSDIVITPFSWSADLLRHQGCDALWFGHPLRQMVREQAISAESREKIAVLPGSRRHEIEANLPVIRQALEGIDRPIVLAAAPTVSPEWLLDEWDGPATVVDTAAAAFAQSRAAVVCSGTATLEAALCHCPCVVVYRGSKLMQAEARIRRPKVRWISLPNILLERTVLPELILWEATAPAIRTALEPLLDDTPERQAQLTAFTDLESVLGPDDAIDQSVSVLAAQVFQ